MFNDELYLDLFNSLLESVVPEAVVDPLPDELQRRLGAKRILGWHVQIIQVGQQFLTTNRHIHTWIQRAE